MSYQHKSVLVQEVIEALALKPGGVYVDCTFGGGGHTTALLQAEPACKIIAFDWDLDAFEHNRERIEEQFPGRVQFIWGNFSQLKKHLKKINVQQVDGILADFGTSQYQITEKKGFSFSRETPLDMRMSAAHYKTTAAHIINSATEQELLTIFWTYGEERNARPLVKAILAARMKKRIITTKDLADIVISVIKPHSRAMHPATRIFQALRIVVNKELENIESFLLQVPEVLALHGRLACISFHSLEDRIVKHFIREHKDVLKPVVKGLISASEEELAVNPSARSAKLRIAEKI